MTNEQQQVIVRPYKISLSEVTINMIQTLANIVQSEPRTTLVHTREGYTVVKNTKRPYVPDLSLTINAMRLLGAAPFWQLFPDYPKPYPTKQHAVLLTDEAVSFFTALVTVHSLQRKASASPVTVALEHIGQRILRPPLEAPPLYELLAIARANPHIGGHSRLPKVRAEDITDPTDPRYIQAEPDVPYNY